MFTYIELFGGVGGFRQALDPLGGRCVFTSEIDPFAKRAYRSLFPRYNLFGDITKVDVDNISIANWTNYCPVCLISEGKKANDLIKAAVKRSLN